MGTSFSSVHSLTLREVWVTNFNSNLVMAITPALQKLTVLLGAFAFLVFASTMKLAVSHSIRSIDRCALCICIIKKLKKECSVIGQSRVTPDEDFPLVCARSTLIVYTNVC